MIYIDLRAPLVSTNRAYRKTAYAYYMTKDGKQFKELLGLEARRSMRGKDRLTGPVEVLVDYWFASDRSDIDGALKLTLDALNGVVWDDDRQVVNLSVGKHKAPTRKDVGLSMTIRAVEQADMVGE